MENNAKLQIQVWANSLLVNSSPKRAAWTFSMLEKWGDFFSHQLDIKADCSTDCVSVKTHDIEHTRRVDPHLPQPSIAYKPTSPPSIPHSSRPAQLPSKDKLVRVTKSCVCVCMNLRDEWLSVFHRDLNAVCCCWQTGMLIHTLLFHFPTHFSVCHPAMNTGLCSEIHNYTQQKHTCCCEKGLAMMVLST